MSNIAVIGECMVEIYNTKKSIYKQTFGGDTFNCAVYLKRAFKKANVEYITIVGDDDISSKMIKFFHKQKIKTTFVEKLKNKTVGMYMISTKNGERSFTYWRSDSAAKNLFMNDSLIQNELLKFELIYFSAITLAIMNKKGRSNFFEIIKRVRNAGVKVAFDSNYRPKLYSSTNEAKEIHNQALENCDIYLPSFDDEQELWGKIDALSIIKKAQDAGCGEIVIKCGKDDVVYSTRSGIKSVKTKQITDIVDATSAGDSFNGVYLASRLKGNDVAKSIKKAKSTASKVIMHKGAIMPKKKKVKNAK